MTWKDLATSTLAAITLAFSYFMVTGYKFPLITNYRWATGVLLILGIAMCAFSTSAGESSLLIKTASVLGIVALILITAGFIFGTKTIFLLLTGNILLLWAIATMRHFLGK